MDEGQPYTELQWPMILAIGMFRVLEKQNPGFENAVREKLKDIANKFDATGTPEGRADAATVREVVDSWIFTTE